MLIRLLRVVKVLYSGMIQFINYSLLVRTDNSLSDVRKNLLRRRQTVAEYQGFDLLKQLELSVSEGM